MRTAAFVRKLGVIDCDMVETTPVVFRGRLYRFESVRTTYRHNTTGRSYFRFVDVHAGTLTPAFAAGHHLGCAFAWRNRMYVYGVPDWGATVMRVFHSADLVRWEQTDAFTTDGWTLFNSTVCRDPGGFVMAFELGEPPEVVGVRFTNRFARSHDLLHWTILPDAYVYTRDRYSACPSLRYTGGWYYMLYLEAYPGPQYGTHLVRSRDLVRWHPSPLNPLLMASDEDKRIANPELTEADRRRIEGIVNINNSDVDLCEHQGKTVLYYSWGTQTGDEFLAEAVFDGTLRAFFERCYPTSSQTPAVR